MLLFRSHISFLLKDLTDASIQDDEQMLACGRSTVKLSMHC